MSGDGLVRYALLSSLQLWRDVIDGLVSHSLWLRALLGLPEKETIYLDIPEEQGQTAAMHCLALPPCTPILWDLRQVDPWSWPH